MSNGHNEPVQFTRGDAERLKAIETTQGLSNTKLDAMDGKLDSFINAHIAKHEALEDKVGINSRFRRVIMRIVWTVISTGGITGLLATVAEAFGWFSN